MSDFDVKEKRFEEDIEDYLTHHGGYTKGDPKKFNRESGLEEDTFVEFIKTSQPKKWERYVKIYAENSEKQIIERFKREVKTTNLLNVMRHGFMDRGIKFYPIFWKPETSLNETTQMQYDANILHCTRQLHYSVHNENSIDIVLFANGIPVVSMELKCQFTGQDTTNAINQYKFDRAGKDAIFAFKERVLVHFAVDLTNVYMTTRLEGAHTYFLPFNQGSNGAGKVGGKGNPVNPNGYDTAYLWERVLCKDSLMEILQKYMHLQQEYDKNGNLVKETMIFPRYHQLDVVTKLLEDVKKNGSGKSYLIQHSAGSGKSNSIAWLAHRLTGLHDYEDNKIFQSVIIVTDRRVLDSQLQSTVYQLQLSEFYEITARSGDDTIRRIIMIPTSGFPDDRESAAVNSVVKDRASFVEYIAFVLGDDYVASMLEGKQMGESGFFANSSDAMPALYEKMLKTSVEGPERIKDIGYVLKMVTDKDIIPDEFRELYETFCNTLKIRR